jgi:hypothetical protein
VDGGENSWRLRLFRSVFFQKFSSRNISQTETDIEDPSSENVQDMEEKNISKYCFDPTMEGRVIAVGVSAINMSSLQPLSKLSKPPKYLSFITY